MLEGARSSRAVKGNLPDRMEWNGLNQLSIHCISYDTKRFAIELVIQVIWMEQTIHSLLKCETYRAKTAWRWVVSEGEHTLLLKKQKIPI